MSDLEDLNRALNVLARLWPDDSDASFIHGTLSDFLNRRDVSTRLADDEHASYSVVEGHCPACGMTSLGLTRRTSQVMCFDLRCPNPDAAHQLLAQNRTEHLVEITADGYTIKHPTLERIADALFDCPANAWMSQLIRNTEPTPGLYRMTGGGADWTLEGVTDGA
jgi:uncharacterized protein DUF6085